MKFHWMLAIASAVLLLVPVTAGALQPDDAQGGSPSGRTMMQQNANESVQATTDMSFSDPGQAGNVRNASYGGIAAGQSDMGIRQDAHGTQGTRNDRPCANGPLCRTYFGQ
nr:hypothetical protein HUO10_006249 [Paraburkholderia busanensis]